MSTNYNGLDDLKNEAVWVAFEKQWDDKRGKLAKRPLNPQTEQGAKSNDAATWVNYDEAKSYAIKRAQKQGTRYGDYFGVGIEFSGVEGLTGIDLDYVIDDEGELKPFAREILELMNSYTELSPSGRGLHILCKLNKPLSEIGSRRRNDELGLEIYDEGRFFTVTEKPYGEIKKIAERTAEVEEIYKKYMAKPEKPKPAQVQAQPVTPPNCGENSKELSDDELLSKMFNSQHGREIESLYNGDISSFNNDHSRADQSFCNYLAFWTGGDYSRIDSLFRRSGLMRDKWDEVHGERTYGAMTIEKALNDVREYYSKDFNKVTLPHESPYKNVIESVNREYNLLEYFQNKFNADLKRFEKYRDRKTGFSNIDKYTSLFPGLYDLGAVTSAGKTTFCHQMADNLARAGDYVLFFSLEQTEFELASKGLSRLTATESLFSAVSSIDIRKGRITDAVKRAIGEYKQFAEREIIIECGFGTTIDTILDTVKRFIDRTGIKPIVFVDYLQIIHPVESSLKHQTTQDAIDSHVKAFKKLQVENDLVLFLICSFNRQNYLTTADFESFKGSGGIEYTADVVYALQLRAMNAAIFDKEANLVTKRLFVHTAKNAKPRKIELLGLKNRYGRANTRYFFDYYSEFDLFIPRDIEEPEADNETKSEFENFRIKHPELCGKSDRKAM